MDNEFLESDTGVGKGSWHRRFSISIPDACDQLLLSHVNANRLIHGVVWLAIQLSKKEEKREERNRNASLFVFGARSATSKRRSGYKRSDIPRRSVEPKASMIVSASIIAPSNSRIQASAYRFCASLFLKEFCMARHHLYFLFCANGLFGVFEPF